MAPGEAQYQRGVRYLVDSQMEDGSWLVRTRSPSFQPYFESDFPHGLRSIHLGRGEQLGGDGVIASSR